MANYFLLIVAVLAAAKTAESLLCWECVSEDGGSCADYFNVSTIRRSYNYDTRNPKEKNCNEATPSFYVGQQRAVCMKKVQTVYGRKQYTRQCAFLALSETVGKCPPETTTSQITTDFCEYCDREQCNGAEGSHANVLWMYLLPAAALLLVKK